MSRYLNCCSVDGNPPVWAQKITCFLPRDQTEAWLNAYFPGASPQDARQQRAADIEMHRQLQDKALALQKRSVAVVATSAPAGQKTPEPEDPDDWEDPDWGDPEDWAFEGPEPAPEPAPEPGGAGWPAPEPGGAGWEEAAGAPAAVAAPMEAAMALGVADEWRLDAQAIERFSQMFADACTAAGEGVDKLGQAEAGPVLSMSGLPIEILLQIWALADVDGDDKLDVREYLVCCFLVQRCVQRQEPPPPSLPPSLLESAGMAEARQAAETARKEAEALRQVAETLNEQLEVMEARCIEVGLEVKVLRQQLEEDNRRYHQLQAPTSSQWKTLCAGIDTEAMVRSFFDRRQQHNLTGCPQLQIESIVWTGNREMISKFQSAGNLWINPRQAHQQGGDSLLFHGCPQDVAANIQAAGLLLQHAGNGMLGRGLYFAPDPRKSSQYFRQRGKFMFICRVNLSKAKYAQNQTFDEFCVYDERHVVVLWMLKIA